MKLLTYLSANILMWLCSLFIIEKLTALMIWYGGVDEFIMAMIEIWLGR